MQKKRYLGMVILLAVLAVLSGSGSRQENRIEDRAIQKNTVEERVIYSGEEAVDDEAPAKQETGEGGEGETGITKQDDSQGLPEETIQYISREFSEETLTQYPYIKAYGDYIRNIGPECGEDEFPIRGYCLLDLNFDGIPELGVFHDSLGSMGGYFCFYRFDGEKAVPVLTERGYPMLISNYTQILADVEREEVFLLKEMYLLWGNSNGQTGYVRKVQEADGIPCVYNLLSLEVDWEKEMNHDLESYSTEDEYLSDEEIDPYLVTEVWEEGKWKEISSAEYLAKKRELLPEERSYVDLRDTAPKVLGPLDLDGDIGYQNWLASDRDLDGLFSQWFRLMEAKEIEEVFGKQGRTVLEAGGRALSGFGLLA